MVNRLYQPTRQQILVADERKKKQSELPKSTDSRPKFQGVTDGDLKKKQRRATMIEVEQVDDAVKDELNCSNYSSRKRNFDDLKPQFHLDPKLENSMQRRNSSFLSGLSMSK